MLSRRILRTKVVKAVYAHTQCEGLTPAASEKNLVASINKAYDLYFHLLALVPEIAEYAAERIRIGENKKLPTYDDLHPNRKFVDNKVIARLVEDEGLQAEISARKLSWKDNRDLIVALYNALVRQPFYMKYMASDKCSFREDAQLVSDIYMTMLEEFEPLESALEAQSILWNDDLGFALIMVDRTLTNVRPTHTELKVVAKFKSDDDLTFARELFAKALINFDSHMAVIEKFTANWDVERIAFMDNIILATATTELTSFESIPVKVTLDEYIEISKFYSTPGSSTFINGILDRVVAMLTAEGKINKSGRGLI
jgi:N utilization substance protein B